MSLDVNGNLTTLQDSVNVCLSVIGEAPVNSITGSNLPTQVALAKQTLQEVNRDVQSKGWWFNTNGSDIIIHPTDRNTSSDQNPTNNWSLSIPEEARRYITIRAARVLQSRFVSSEDLHKFSYNEELVSLATLQQSHVRNGGNSTSFSSFPSDLKNLGIEEVMFLQGSAEEKLLTLRLGTELKQQSKLTAEIGLLADQEALVAQQKLTEVQETTKRTREHELIDAQETLLQKQILTEAEQVAKVQEEVDLLQSQDALVLQQKDQLEKQIALELTEEKAYSDAITGIASGTTYRDFAAELRMMGVQEPTFYQLPAYKKKEALKDATKLRTATATETGTDATEIAIVNNIRRMIGEAPITALNGDSIASEAVRMLRKTSTEMQGRGWWFNTEYDVELTADGTGRIATAGMLTVELNDYDTRIKNVGGTKYLYDYKTKSHTTFSGTTKAKVIYERSLDDIPQKFQEYLEVRVAILLTEMYPRDGVDIQRLPRIERELEAYFKDRENDEGNYSIFDNYDTASRIGINRNYDIV